MKRVLIALCLTAGAAATLPAAETNVVDGMTVVCEDGVCRVLDPLPVADSGPWVREPAAARPRDFPAVSRMAQGYMDVVAFLAFLQDRREADPFAGKGMWVVVLLALLGGLAMNLTPCVLPMIPVNLMVIGKSASSGAWYGLGIMLAYGTLGVLATVGGLAFGSIQSNPWFNLAVALVFVALALSLFGVFFIDFSKSRSRFRMSSGLTAQRSPAWGGAFLMGLLAAMLAGACVAPVLIAVLLLTARLFAAGKALALALPFVMGLGMALPWPFVGAGLSVLPKPGRWMKWVNRGFGVVLLAFAFWYARLAYGGFGFGRAERGTGAARNVVEAVPATFGTALSRIAAESPGPVLVDCWASWCKNCSAMERATLADPAVRRELEKFVVVRLQAEDIGELRRLPGFGDVMGLPAFAVFDL